LPLYELKEKDSDCHYEGNMEDGGSNSNIVLEKRQGKIQCHEMLQLVTFINTDVLEKSNASIIKVKQSKKHENGGITLFRNVSNNVSVDMA
jgi:hypothetical protein